MKRIKVDSVEHFAELFKVKTVEMTNAIKESIQEAISQKKRTANLFEVEIEGIDTVMGITLSKRQWIDALETCLKHYEEWEHSDDAIDTYLLIKQLKDGQAS
jgi:uncharacterized protein Yka (UPF0111/DUF47 family)